MDEEHHPIPTMSTAIFDSANRGRCANLPYGGVVGWKKPKRGMEILGSVAANSKHPKTRHAQSIHLSVRRAEESSKMLQKDMEKGEAATLDKPEVFKFPTTISPSH